MSRTPRSAGGTDQTPVVWSSSLFAATGYAEETRNHILSLDRAGVPVGVNPIFWTRWHTRLAPGQAERLEQLVLIEAPERFIHVMHYKPARYFRHPWAIRHIGRPMSETEFPPPDWVAGCNGVDEVWVPSHFNLESFAAAGVSPAKLHVIPESLDLELYDPSVPPRQLDGVSGFVFLSIFGWSPRKGWDVLVRAYLEEFDPDEDVTLVMKIVTLLGRSLEDHVNEVLRFVREDLGRDPARSPRIVVLDIDPGAEGMPGLYRAADAFVLPSRGEGWGRPYMEAMAMGLPTIATRWSGNLEFMNDENSFLVDCELVDVSAAGARDPAWAYLPYRQGQRWAEPSVEHLRELMRTVVERPDEAKATGARGREYVATHCSWKRVAGLMIDRLRA